MGSVSRGHKKDYEMVHAYHLIFGAYGFWLPNDPRGSWSEFVGSWELVRFGRTTRSVSRKILTAVEERQRAKNVLKYPAVVFNDAQVQAVAAGFQQLIQRCRIEVWACSILPEHVHLVIARHRLSAESMAKLLKAEATKQLRAEEIDPLANFATSKSTGLPSPWAKGQWKGFLDSDPYICTAISYVEGNPEKEGRPRQNWNFVTRYPGLELGCITYT